MLLHEKCAVQKTIWRRSLVRLRSKGRNKSRRELGGRIGEIVVIRAWSLTKKKQRGWGCWRQEQKERQG